jgi:hypothetical protein
MDSRVHGPSRVVGSHSSADHIGDRQRRVSLLPRTEDDVKRSGAVSRREKSSALVASSRVPRVPTQLKKVRAELAGVKNKAAHLIARNPFRVLAGALAAGFVLAKLKSLF